MKRLFRYSPLIPAIVCLLSVGLWVAHPLIHEDCDDHLGDCGLCQVVASGGATEPDAAAPVVLPAPEWVGQIAPSLSQHFLLCKRADLVRGPPVFDL